MKCLKCGKTHKNSFKSFTWKEHQLCPKCYEVSENVERIRLLKEDRKYDLVYVKKDMQILSIFRKRR